MPKQKGTIPVSGLTAFAKPQPKQLSVKLHEKGQRFAGIVCTDPVLVQQTVYKGKPGEMATWPDGNPKLQWQFKLLVIHEDVCKCEAWCQEGAKNAVNGTDADNKVRNMYVPASGNLFNAMVAALNSSETPRENGAPIIETGGAFVFARTGLDYEKAEKTGGKPPATFQVVYKLPTPEWLAQVKKYEATVPKVGAVPTHDGSPSMTPQDLSDLLTVGLAPPTRTTDAAPASLAAQIPADDEIPTVVQPPIPDIPEGALKPGSSGEVISFDALLADLP